MNTIRLGTAAAIAAMLGLSSMAQAGLLGGGIGAGLGSGITASRMGNSVTAGNMAATSANADAPLHRAAKTSGDAGKDGSGAQKSAASTASSTPSTSSAAAAGSIGDSGQIGVSHGTTAASVTPTAGASGSIVH
jgi:hypothetical protein